ncbi:hypothetical protein [Cryptosporangium japonicum]|uniref:Uncharacterized protein n=1 Tax=Cryptosporangium japonicum TaxID=80872 RepID=A0ABP3D361_9ACTN
MTFPPKTLADLQALRLAGLPADQVLSVKKAGLADCPTTVVRVVLKRGRTDREIAATVVRALYDAGFSTACGGSVFAGYSKATASGEGDFPDAGLMNFDGPRGAGDGKHAIHVVVGSPVNPRLQFDLTY